MRQTIRKKKSGNRREKLIGFLSFFVFAPLVSILLGLGLVKFLILPYFQGDEDINSVDQEEVMQNEGDLSTNNDNETTEEKEENNPQTKEENKYTEQYRKTGITLFNIQVGSFSDMENASALVSDMKNKGLAGYVVKNESFKVFSGSFYNREEADNLITSIKNSYNDAFINAIVVGEGTIDYNTEDQPTVNQLVELFAIVDDFYGQETSLWATTIQKNDASFIKQIMIDNTNVIKTKLDEIKGNSSSEDINHILAELHKLVKDRESLVNSMKENEAIPDAYIEFNTLLFNYFTMI